MLSVAAVCSLRLSLLPNLLLLLLLLTGRAFHSGKIVLLTRMSSLAVLPSGLVLPLLGLLTVSPGFGLSFPGRAALRILLPVLAAGLSFAAVLPGHDLAPLLVSVIVGCRINGVGEGMFPALAAGQLPARLDDGHSPI